ncbi:MAG: TfpX/TfpZ family type IV pilin accessory protein [Gammaproteobacteria bacterium]
MVKLKASLTHLALSSVVVGSIFLIIFFAWYPYPYFEIRGAGDIVLILIGVDLVLGPLLTFIVYKPKKKTLVFDLSVIVMIQLAALVYGVSAIYEERPYFMVYAVDRFTLLAEKDVDFSEITDQSLMEKPGIGPLMVLAKMPEDPQEKQQLMTEVVFENKPDLDRRPKYWVPYPENLEIVFARTKTLQELKDKRDSVAPQVDKIVASHGGDIDDLAFAPMIGKNGDFAIVLERNTGRLADAIAVDPWLDDDLPLSHDE